MSVVKVLVVDDSATMRSLISAVLRRDPEITVVGQAGDPLEARDAIKQLNPDVITLDVEMPNMNGLAFLEKIMRLRPMPVVMVSTLTQVGAEVSLAALELGAVECVGKPTGGAATDAAFADLPAKVKAAARARVRSVPDRAPNHAAKPDFKPDGRIVAIGSSTGGVEALLSVLSAFPANCPPTVITQHMPGTFTKSFAERLNRTCAARVAEASEGAVLEVGQIYLAPGGDNHLQVTGHSQLRCRLVPEPAVNGHRPSVDVLFNSIVKTAASKAIGVILTGMGRDGAQGLLAMRKAGSYTIGQNEATSVVYGMPKVAHEMGGVTRQLPLERIGAEIINQCNVAREPA